VQSSVPEEKIIRSLRSGQKRRFEDAFAANQETSPAEYLYIGELITLFTGTSYASDPRLWDAPLTDLLSRVRHFRNDVMHPVHSLAALEEVEALANLPRWAGEVSEKLRAIVALLCPGRR